MRTATIFAVVAGLVCAPVSASAADVEARVVRNGQDVRIAHHERLADKLVALAESCSVNNAMRQPASDQTWSKVLGSDSFVHVVLSRPRRLNLEAGNNQGRERRLIREILLPLPMDSWPEGIFVKSGNDVIPLTKYLPYLLRELVLEEDLRLRTMPPYDSLLNLPSQR